MRRPFFAKKLNCQQQGFSLVEVLVVVGLASILALGISQLMINAQKGQAGMSDKFELLDLNTSLNFAFKQSKNTCDCFFKKNISNPTNFFTSSSGPSAGTNLSPNLNLSFFSSSTCDTSSEKPIIQNGKPVGTSKLQVKSASLTKPFSIGGTTYLVDLTIDAQADNNTLKFKPLVIKNIVMTYDSGMMNCNPEVESLKNVGCVSPEILTGFDSYGKPICVNSSQVLSSVNCPSESVLTGFSSTGQPVCKSITSFASLSTGSTSTASGTDTGTTTPTSGTSTSSSTASPALTYENTSMICSSSTAVAPLVDAYLAGGRCADPSGLAWWSTQITSGSVTMAAAVAQITPAVAAESQSERTSSYCPMGYYFYQRNVCKLNGT